MTRNHIGVDLSKDVLDICDPRRGEARVANEPAAIAGWLAGLGPDDLVVYEATSGCDRPLRLALARPASPACGSIRCTPGTSPARSTAPRPTGSMPRCSPASAPSGSPRRRAAPTRPARSCASSSSAATSSSAWRCRRRTASPHCALPLVANDIRDELANLAAPPRPHRDGDRRPSRPPPALADGRPAAALDPGLRRGHRRDAARPPGRARHRRPPRRRLARRRRAAGPRHRALPRQALPRRRPAPDPPRALHGRLERAASRRLPRGLRRAR